MGVRIQDAHVICPKLEGNEETGFFGVFDGHGGTYSSEYWYVSVLSADLSSRNHLLPVLLSQPEYKGKDVWFLNQFDFADNSR